jgi:hypothetical protein
MLKNLKGMLEIFWGKSKRILESFCGRPTEKLGIFSTDPRKLLETLKTSGKLIGKLPQIK